METKALIVFLAKIHCLIEHLPDVFFQWLNSFPESQNQKGHEESTVSVSIYILPFSFKFHF